MFMKKSYLQKVWQNAVQKTWPSLDVQFIFVNCMGFLVGAFCIYRFGETVFATEQFWGWLFGPFSGAVAINFLNFGLNLVLAPSRIDKESTLLIKTLNNEITKHQDPALKIRAEPGAMLKLEISILIASLTSIALDYSHTNLSPQKLVKIQEDIDLVKAKMEVLTNNEHLWRVCNDAVYWASNAIRDRQKKQVDQDDRKRVVELSKEAMKLLQNG